MRTHVALAGIRESYVSIIPAAGKQFSTEQSWDEGTDNTFSPLLSSRPCTEEQIRNKSCSTSAEGFPKLLSVRSVVSCKGFLKLTGIECERTRFRKDM
jgi:hypothetical protein